VTASELFFVEEGQGPALLLIHGTGGDCDIWKPLAARLATGHRVIRYDRRGFGRSERRPWGRKLYYRHHADDAAALLESLGAAPASVLGWSAGGIVALALAAFHPQLVSRVVVFEPPLWAARHPSAAMLAGFLKMILLRLLGLKRRAAEVFVKTALGPGSEKLDPEEEKKLFSNLDGLFAEIDAGTGEEVTPALITASGVSITDVVGENSAPFLAAAADRLAATVPSAKVVRVPDAGHLALAEQADRFADLLGPLL
jgi:pimeloyl-ACP methyl ester carboxylesterase